ncbi:MAG: ATPase [Rhodobacteraceae bacterium]|nr:ATPase [Paracoccaceae bacterium]
MSEWKAKRFWKEARVVEDGARFAVELDGRRVKTPAKAALEMPTRGMAQAVAAEWDAQEGVIDPRGMPFTRSANAAIDKVAHQHGEVADMLAGYGDADLLCYRAEAPVELVAHQAQEWDPALGWARDALGVDLEVFKGVVHHPQSTSDIAGLTARVHRMGNFHLAAFHDLVSLSGSLILGFGAALGWRGADDIWKLSQLDEIWQAQQWGADEEAQKMSEAKRQAFLHAKAFFDLS